MWFLSLIAFFVVTSAYLETRRVMVRTVCKIHTWGFQGDNNTCSVCYFRAGG